MASSVTAALLGSQRSQAQPRLRLCARPACPGDASATMTYDYAGRSAWLDELDADASPAGYDLCSYHADHLGVPNGWTRTDRRSSGPPQPARAL